MLEDWEPKTKLGKAVKAGEITDIDEILKAGKVILEPEIVDMLLPELKSVTIEIRPTQRVTDSGRRISYRAVVLVGDGNGHIGVGVGKSSEVRSAIEYATKNAKKNIIYVPRGCGSWECQCNMEHSIPFEVSGKESSSIVELKPAPRGIGLAANDTIKEVLSLVGIKDVWSRARGSTSNRYNIVLATIKALKKLNRRNDNNE